MVTIETPRPLRMSELDLARIGSGEVAYVRTLSADHAQRLFPAAKLSSQRHTFFSLHAADGELLALTETRAEAHKRAWRDKLFIALLH